jgi:hypothetical protein
VAMAAAPDLGVDDRHCTYLIATAVIMIAITHVDGTMIVIATAVEMYFNCTMLILKLDLLITEAHALFSVVTEWFQIL